MITLSAGIGNNLITILLTLLIMLLLIIYRRKSLFKVLAIINKIIMPSLVTKDLAKLKSHEKLILGYRFWVTKNSL